MHFTRSPTARASNTSSSAQRPGAGRDELRELLSAGALRRDSQFRGDGKQRASRGQIELNCLPPLPASDLGLWQQAGEATLQANRLDVRRQDGLRA
jgi:hypothetical protein